MTTRPSASYVLGTMGILLLAVSCAPRRTPVNAVALKATPTDADAARATTLWGYVYKVTGKDTVPVRSATVWTDPPSDQVFTDSLGYWEIRDGVVDSRYRVLAKTEGVTGRTAQLAVTPGKSVKASVLVGVEETPWPPTLSLDDKAITLRKGPKGTRCCE
ncbi:MAG: hypothetical protein IT353_09890 [Gemmatimonadaceae bacterium]|nr:hypothetical protein [Gemmatimonadaceae bacterium]